MKIKNSICILLSSLWLLSACGTTVPQNNPQKEEPSAVSVLDIVKEKTTEYTIIISARADKWENSACTYMGSSIKKITGIHRMPLADDFVERGSEMDPLAKEILIGQTNRPESEQALAMLDGADAVAAVIGEKIAIIGTTPKITYAAVERFIADYVSEAGVQIPADLCVLYNAEQQVFYKDYTNADAPVANDPWIINDPNGNGYYYCWSGGGIYIAHCETLSDIPTANKRGVLVWTPPAGTEYSQELWAPELHYLQGNWYVYVAADDGDNMNHRMYVLRGTDPENPLMPFTFMGKITDSSDKWAIDGTVFTFKNELYYVWSGWESATNVSQNIYIAHMSDPCTLDSERVLLSSPQYAWETNTFPMVNEGPAAVVGEETIYIIFSASGSWADTYCLAELRFDGGDILDPENWHKASQPVMTQQKGTHGPGHCSFATDVTGTLWMFYHANEVAGSGWSGRSLRMQPVKKWENDELIIGKAVRPETSIQLPYLHYVCVPHHPDM